MPISSQFGRICSCNMKDGTFPTTSQMNEWEYYWACLWFLYRNKCWCGEIELSFKSLNNSCFCREKAHFWQFKICYKSFQVVSEPPKFGELKRRCLALAKRSFTATFGRHLKWCSQKFDKFSLYSCLWTNSNAFPSFHQNWGLQHLLNTL